MGHLSLWLVSHSTRSIPIDTNSNTNKISGSRPLGWKGRLSNFQY
jgi:hypothetical protein